MIVTRGGKEYEPTNDPAIIAPKQKDMSHAAFVLWETMIGLQLERQQAVERWERVNALHDKADANQDHPNVGRIHSRIQSLESDILNRQITFLGYEQIARREWEGGPHSIDDFDSIMRMYNQPGWVKTLPALWYCPLGESSSPAPFPMSTTALQFASPALIRVYQGGKR